MRLPVKSSSKITVVKPPMAVPANFCTSATTPKTREVMSISTPRTVMMCSGAEEKEPMLLMAYLMRERVDHLLSPAVRWRTR